MSSPMPSPRRKKGRVPLRNIRVSDELWNAALDAADYRGDPSLSHIIRAGLTAYVKQTDRMRARDAAAATEEREG